MNIDRLKKILLPLFIIVVGGCYIIVDSFSNEKKDNDASALTAKTAAPVQQTQINTQKQNDTVKIKTVVPVMDNLDSLQSPFSLLSAAGNPQTQNPSTGNGTANIVSLPKAIIPPSATSFRSPNGFNSVLPGPSSVTLPGPGTVAGIREIVVKAILQGTNNMVAILGDGKDEIIVSPGENSEWGYVSNITRNSVVLNDKVIRLAEQ